MCQGCKIVIFGWLMENVIVVGQVLGYLKILEDFLIDFNELNFYLLEKVMIMCIGLQGELMVVLLWIVNGIYCQIMI